MNNIDRPKLFGKIHNRDQKPVTYDKAHIDNLIAHLSEGDGVYDNADIIDFLVLGIYRSGWYK